PQAFILCTARDRLLAVVRRHRGAEMLAGVSVVHALRGVLVDRPLEVAPVFLGPIGQRYHLQVWPYSQHRRQLGIQLCRQCLLLGLWRSPVLHGVESLGVLVIECDCAAAHLSVAGGATKLLGPSLPLGGLTLGLGLALGILVRDHHAIQGYGDYRRLGWHDFLLPQRLLPALAVAFPDSAQQLGQTVATTTRGTRDAQLGEQCARLVRGHVPHQVRDLSRQNGRVPPPDDPGTQLQRTEALAAVCRTIQVPGHRDRTRGTQIGLRLLLQALVPDLAVNNHGVGIDIVARQVCRLQLVFKASDSVPELDFERLEGHLGFCAALLTTCREQTL